MSKVLLGIVIIGRNEGERLKLCLASVCRAGASFVYVDLGSTDGSQAAAYRIGAQVVDLDMSQPFTAARARNAGFTALLARNPAIEYVQFIDGDCELVDGWLETAHAFLAAHSDVAIVSGRNRERYPERSVYNRLCDIEWNTPVGETRVCGGNFLARVEAFKSVGGFRDTLIAGEEPDLCLRLSERGWRIWRLDQEMTLHDAAIFTMRQAWRRAVRSGHAFAEVSWLHRDEAFDWHRSVWSAVAWTGLLTVSLAGSMFDYRALLGVLVYLAQVVRIGFLSPQPERRPDFAYGLIIMTSKVAETVGIAKYLANAMLHRSSNLIEYK